LETCHGEASFRSWLYTITLNICRGRLRKRKILERLRKSLESLNIYLHEGKDSLSVGRTEAAIIDKERSEKLWQAVYQLDEKLRIPIILYYDQNIPVAEISQIMNTKDQTIYSRLHKARSLLYEALRSDYPLLFGGGQDE
jgi:RNA polymerase sigma-70 factor, ECF subfamily